MRRRLSVAQEALDELGTPAAMEPRCPTVSNVDIKTVGDAWLSSSPCGCLEGNPFLSPGVIVL